MALKMISSKAHGSWKITIKEMFKSSSLEFMNVISYLGIKAFIDVIKLKAFEMRLSWIMLLGTNWYHIPARLKCILKRD